MDQRGSAVVVPRDAGLVRAVLSGIDGLTTVAGKAQLVPAPLAEAAGV